MKKQLFLGGLAAILSGGICVDIARMYWTAASLMGIGFLCLLTMCIIADREAGREDRK